MAVSICQPANTLSYALQIRDRGMDKKTVKKMFDPFFTAGKNKHGTGLGLSLVYDIISDLNGDITVSSEVNKGTVIEILIPAETGKFVSLP